MSSRSGVAPVVAAESERKALGLVDRTLQLSKPGRALLVGPDGTHMILPRSLYSILRAVIRPLSAGQGVTILPVLAELTTQQAAEQLGMSRPSLIKLLESGEMPFHRSGTHRRIYLRDLLLFKSRRDAAAARSVDELAADAQELGIYDE